MVKKIIPNNYKDMVKDKYLKAVEECTAILDKYEIPSSMIILANGKGSKGCGSCSGDMLHISKAFMHALRSHNMFAWKLFLFAKSLIIALNDEYTKYCGANSPTLPATLRPDKT